MSRNDDSVISAQVVVEAMSVTSRKSNDSVIDQTRLFTAQLNENFNKRNYDQVIEDCDKRLKVNKTCGAAFSLKIKALCHKSLVDEAYGVAKQWMQAEPNNRTAQKELNRLDRIQRALREFEDDDEDDDDNSSNRTPRSVKSTVHDSSPLHQCNSKEHSKYNLKGQFGKDNGKCIVRESSSSLVSNTQPELAVTKNSSEICVEPSEDINHALSVKVGYGTVLPLASNNMRNGLDASALVRTNFDGGLSKTVNGALTLKTVSTSDTGVAKDAIAAGGLTMTNGSDVARASGNLNVCSGPSKPSLSSSSNNKLISTNGNKSRSDRNVGTTTSERRSSDRNLGAQPERQSSDGKLNSSSSSVNDSDRSSSSHSGRAESRRLTPRQGTKTLANNVRSEPSRSGVYSSSVKRDVDNKRSSVCGRRIDGKIAVGASDSRLSADDISKDNGSNTTVDKKPDHGVQSVAKQRTKCETLLDTRTNFKSGVDSGQSQDARLSAGSSLDCTDVASGSDVRGCTIVCRYRSAPRGLTSSEYTLCNGFLQTGVCQYGDRCSEAHSEEELAEWKQYFNAWKTNFHSGGSTGKGGGGRGVRGGGRTSGSSQHKSSRFVEQLIEKWLLSERSETVMPLHRVAMLDSVERQHFYIQSITVGPRQSQNIQKITDGCQEWTNPNFGRSARCREYIYRILVTFQTDIYGTFRQSVILGFHSEPVVVQHVCVDVKPINMAELTTLVEDQELSAKLISVTDKELVAFEPRLSYLTDADLELLHIYPSPLLDSNFCPSPVVLEPCLTSVNYNTRLNHLLYVEEIEQASNIAKFNVSVNIALATTFQLVPSATSSGARFAQNNELFGHITLGFDVSEDTAGGRLILQNVSTVYVIPQTSNSGLVPANKAYEAIVEEKGKTFIYIRLSGQCVTELRLTPGTNLHAQVLFNLNRLPLCEKHQAVDRLTNVDLIFPSLYPTADLILNVDREWSSTLKGTLNNRQKEAIAAMLAEVGVPMPPILIMGPYGTGKTLTLAHATTEILRRTRTRILICTHSNSAADLYIKDYLHPYVEAGHSEATPVRVLYQFRRAETVPDTVLRYSLRNNTPERGTFRLPTREDLAQHRVIVSTLSTTKYLYDLHLEPGFFTHILMDEAGQAMECESIAPLTLAGNDTRLVLAGDHMQLNPEVYSSFAREHGLNKSLLERLYEFYPASHPLKIQLCENYRSHAAIVKYTSELFYGSSLVASGKGAHVSGSWGESGAKGAVLRKYQPLTFFTARGDDIQHVNSTSYYNDAEVYELVDKVCELERHWPVAAWGPFNESSIGVVCYYSAQVMRIRAELRKRKLSSVSVEKVITVQGKEFRAVFISTVRTHRTCSTDSSVNKVDYGFLSSAKLLNTAITRAQSLVAVVGDPIALCSIGKCRKLWERYVELCENYSSLHGSTLSLLHDQLERVELKKTYILNPLAPEFIPGRTTHPHVLLSPPMNVASVTDTTKPIQPTAVRSTALNIVTYPTHWLQSTVRSVVASTKSSVSPSLSTSAPPPMNDTQYGHPSVIGMQQHMSTLQPQAQVPSYAYPSYPLIVRVPVGVASSAGLTAHVQHQQQNIMRQQLHQQLQLQAAQQHQLHLQQHAILRYATIAAGPSGQGQPPSLYANHDILLQPAAGHDYQTQPHLVANQHQRVQTSVRTSQQQDPSSGLLTIASNSPPSKDWSSLVSSDDIAAQMSRLHQQQQQSRVATASFLNTGGATGVSRIWGAPIQPRFVGYTLTPANIHNIVAATPRYQVHPATGAISASRMLVAAAAPRTYIPMTSLPCHHPSPTVGSGAALFGVYDQCSSVPMISAASMLRSATAPAHIGTTLSHEVPTYFDNIRLNSDIPQLSPRSVLGDESDGAQKLLDACLPSEKLESCIPVAPSSTNQPFFFVGNVCNPSAKRDSKSSIRYCPVVANPEISDNADEPSSLSLGPLKCDDIIVPPPPAFSDWLSTTSNVNRNVPSHWEPLSTPSCRPKVIDNLGAIWQHEANENLAATPTAKKNVDKTSPNLESTSNELNRTEDVNEDDRKQREIEEAAYFTRFMSFLANGDNTTNDNNNLASLYEFARPAVSNNNTSHDMQSVAKQNNCPNGSLGLAIPVSGDDSGRYDDVTRMLWFSKLCRSDSSITNLPVSSDHMAIESSPPPPLCPVHDFQQFSHASIINGSHNYCTDNVESGNELSDGSAVIPVNQSSQNLAAAPYGFRDRPFDISKQDLERAPRNAGLLSSFDMDELDDLQNYSPRKCDSVNIESTHFTTENVRSHMAWASVPTTRYQFLQEQLSRNNIVSTAATSLHNFSDTGNTNVSRQFQPTVYSDVNANVAGRPNVESNTRAPLYMRGGNQTDVQSAVPASDGVMSYAAILRQRRGSSPESSTQSRSDCSMPIEQSRCGSVADPSIVAAFPTPFTTVSNFGLYDKSSRYSFNNRNVQP